MDEDSEFLTSIGRCIANPPGIALAARQFCLLLIAFHLTLCPAACYFVLMQKSGATTLPLS